MRCVGRSRHTSHGRRINVLRRQFCAVLHNNRVHLVVELAQPPVHIRQSPACSARRRVRHVLRLLAKHAATGSAASQATKTGTSQCAPQSATQTPTTTTGEHQAAQTADQRASTCAQSSPGQIFLQPR